jgi:hypothetical protein
MAPKGYTSIKIPEDLESFYDRVKRILAEQGRLHEWLHQELGMPARKFHEWAQRKRPNPKFIKQVAFALGVDRKYLEATILPRKQSKVYTSIDKLLKYDDRTLDQFIGFPLTPKLRTWIREMLLQIVNETRARRPIVEGMRWHFSLQKAKEQMQLEHNLTPEQFEVLTKRDERWQRKLETLTAKIEKDTYYPTLYQ